MGTLSDFLQAATSFVLLRILRVSFLRLATLSQLKLKVRKTQRFVWGGLGTSKIYCLFAHATNKNFNKFSSTELLFLPFFIVWYQ